MHVDTILTYIKFRGDLDIKKYPFNEVDALILSELAYIQFDNIVPSVVQEGRVTIKEAARNYKKREGKETAFYGQFELLFELMANSQRYADMALSNYISILDTKERQQFAALHIQVTPFQTFIAFRGTDETIVGWREDCNMSYLMPVPAQISSVNYVNRTARNPFKKYWIGGHSKGGNLAIYSSVFCESKIQKKIINVYSFDGPGFNHSMIERDAYKRIQNRIVAYVPESSVVGMLMEHEENYKIVKSGENAFMQHNGFSWAVDSTCFLYAENRDKFSNNISNILKTWLEKIDPSERKVFVDAVFNIFEAGGIVEIFDFKEITVQKATAMLKAVMILPPEQREIVNKLIKSLVEVSKKSGKGAV